MPISSESGAGGDLRGPKRCRQNHLLKTIAGFLKPTSGRSPSTAPNWSGHVLRHRQDGAIHSPGQESVFRSDRRENLELGSYATRITTGTR
jgi:hypothetical protein